MAKKIYYAVYQRGLLVEHKNRDGVKMPMIFLSKKAAEEMADDRRTSLKKPNTVKAVTI